MSSRWFIKEKISVKSVSPKITLCGVSVGKLNSSSKEHLHWSHNWLVIWHSQGKCIGALSIALQNGIKWRAGIFESEKYLVTVAKIQKIV